MMTDEMMLIDVFGKAHPISKHNTVWILGAGWIFFVVSFGFNCIFYKIHPSATDISLGAIKRRLLCGEEGGWPDNEERGRPLLERLRSCLCIFKNEQERAEEAGEEDEGDGSEKTTLKKLRSCFSCCKKKLKGTDVEGNHDDEEDSRIEEKPFLEMAEHNEELEENREGVKRTISERLSQKESQGM